ncbi:MAG: hypothetical protein IJ711_03320 [Lachnospiraceae bacterium]|nr:hypothetical protein [Lachnospiraceae bacterium]
MEHNFFIKCLRFISKKTDNRGSSIVLTIVTIAFVSMLVAMSAHMSYYNYAMKYSDRSSKDNFYSAEEALAEINIGLQTIVSDAMTVAYYYALQQNTSVEMNSRELYFEQIYEERLLKALKDPDLGDNYYDVDKLRGFLVKTAYANEVGARIITVKDTANVSNSENTIFRKKGGIVLNNVKLTYTDPSGYVTSIWTDIYLKLPDVSLAATVGVPELENCAIIANNKLDVIENNNIRISGDVYGGKNGLYVDGDTNLLFGKKDNDTDGVSYKLVAGNVKVHNSTTHSAYAMEATKNYDVWTEDILVDSGKLSLEGNTYVQDDLTVEGKNSRIALAGNYYGYGDELYQSYNSSSILVNGGGTSLDFSGLKNLLLAGHAYIGARHYNANLDDDYVEDLNAEPDPETPTTYAENTKDLMMGESIGVKSNQLMYLVPKECVGYYKDTTDLYLGKNPISYEEYLTLTQTYQYEYNEDGTIKRVAGTGAPVYKKDSYGNLILQYDEVNLGIVMNKTGQTIAGSGATYRPVFRRVNGTVLVYYYLEFTSERAANEFFKAYYENDKEGVESYVKSYISELKLNSALKESAGNLHLAGNAFKYDDSTGELVLIEDTATVNVNDSDLMADNRASWQDAYLGYSKKMLPNTNTLSSEHLSRDIFYNLVVKYSDFASVIPAGTRATYENGSVKALVINNQSAPVTINYADVSGGVNLILATGDVKLSTDFNGLLLSGGEVSLEAGCNIVQSNPVAVRKAMVAKNGSATIADLFLDGSAYSAQSEDESDSTETGDETEEEKQIAKDDDYVKVEDLIIYEKWTKR